MYFATDPKIEHVHGRRLLGYLAAAVFVLLTIPRLVSYGMYVDGVVYAAISRNLAVGNGSIWQPHFTRTIDPTFYEHPPLAFWLQSLAYRVFGDTHFVESFYGLFAGVLILLGIQLTWRALRSPELTSGTQPSGSWLPVMLFSVIPITTWCFSNNMLENTMTVWTTFALWAVIVGLRQSKPSVQVQFGVAAGLLVTLGFLTKGPTSLFVLSVPMAALLLAHVHRRAVLHFYLGMIIALAVMFLALSSWDAARMSLLQYLRQQVVASLAGHRANHSTRLYIVAQLAGELSYALALCAVVWFVVRKRVRLSWTKQHTFLLLVALSASLPVLLSTKQNNWYVFQSLPVYSILLASVLSPVGVVIEAWAEIARVRYAITAITVVLIASTVAATVSEYGKVRKHTAFFPDFVAQPLQLPAETLVAACPTPKVDYALNANFARYFDVSLDPHAAPIGNLYLAEVNAHCEVPPTCRAIHPPRPHTFQLFDCRSAE